MQARANPEYKKGLVVACGGVHFGTDWVDVPAGQEHEAENHPWLMVREEAEATPTAEASSAPSAAEEVDATNAAIDLADEHDIDLTTVEGTGKDGRIVLSDVEALVEED